jgi:hypothetical protein
MAVMAAGAGLIGCGGGSSTTTINNPNPTPTPTPTLVTRGQYGPLQFTLSTTKYTFPTGETVPFIFTIANTGTEPVPFTGQGFGTPQLAGVKISPGTSSTPVWLSGSLLGGSGSLASDTLAPGEVRNVNFDWNQRTNPTTGEPGAQGTLVAPGTYRVSAYSLINIAGVTDRETQLAVAPLNITIR